MKKVILILDENGILEYVKVDIERCKYREEILQVCSLGKEVKCINCNMIVGNILERKFNGNFKIGYTRVGLGIDTTNRKNIKIE